MYRFLSPDYRLDLEIERTFKRLRRGQASSQPLPELVLNTPTNSTPDSAEVLSPAASEMAEEVPQDSMTMANDRNCAIRGYAVFDPEAMNTGIVRTPISAAQFEFKPIMFQMLQTIGYFNGAATEDPHLHLKQFLDVASNFKIPGVTNDAFRLRLFPFSLGGKAKNWLNSLDANSINTWNKFAEKFLIKFFPPTMNAKMRTDITSFRQQEDEPLFEAWERFKQLVKNPTRCI